MLHDITLTVRPGEHVAIVGRTGAGKSTLLALLAGLYPPASGRIELAGRDPLTFSDDERRATLGFVSQRVNLFSGTVYDNLAMGDQNLTHDLLRRAAAIAGADPFIRTLPHGYDTTLAADTHGNGMHLSAGQRQLLALARALTTRPAVLLLDEATAVIDGASDAAFRAALHEHVLPLGTAVVTVAHRLATARDAHRVLVIQGGQIAEQGTPSALLATDGIFAALNALEEAGWDWQRDPRLTMTAPSSLLRPSDESKVEPSGFVGGAFGGAGTGVADEHVGAGPAGDGHEAGFGAACGEPAVGRGVAEPVGPEALDAGPLGAAA